MQQPAFAEFFAGIGLVRLGLGPDWHCAYANDFDDAKRRMYADNFPVAADHLDGRDIREVQATDIAPCQLWTASFPCNNTSLAGNYRGIKGESSSMVHEFLRLIEDAGPDAPTQILLENVMGFLIREDGTDLHEVLQALNALGYATDVLMLDAKWWVPQSRRRLFVIANRDADPANQLLPLASNYRPQPILDFVHRYDDLNWSFVEAPPPQDQQPRLSQIIEDLPANDERWWSCDRAEYLYSQFSDRHRTLADAMAA